MLLSYITIPKNKKKKKIWTKDKIEPQHMQHRNDVIYIAWNQAEF